MRHAAAQLDPLPQCGRSDSGGQPGTRDPGENVLVAELQPDWLEAEAHRYRGVGLEDVARRRPGSALQHRKVLPLALVLELWRRRHDRSLHPLDRCSSLGYEE